MSVNDSDKKQWSDPKDYGLPFVEIIPIRAKTEPAQVPSEIELPAPNEIADESAEVIVSADSEPIEAVVTPLENAEVAVKPEEVKPAPVTQLEEKKSSTWVWAVVVIALGIVAVIVWQIMATNKTVAVAPPVENLDKPIEKPVVIPVELTPDSTAADQNQLAVDQDTIQSTTISNPNISKPAETGTTIANNATGNLIRVESKSERPRYFIIVGSLPNEALATEEARKYFGKSAELYLISPDDGARNYRLALYSFGGFSLASEKLEEIKSQYTEELWILKY